MDQPTLINMDDVEVVEINKICPRCKRLKGENEYYPSNRTSDGLTTYCKECHAEMQKEKYANKPPGWHWRTYGKDWYERNKDQELSRALENNYGITLEDKKIC
jgi:hypothetical protein